jgi:hypothetical protein
VLDINKLGISSEECSLYTSYEIEAAKEACDKLCGPGVVAEEELMDAEDAMRDKLESRNKAWVPVARFLVLRRFVKPLEHFGLLHVVKQKLYSLLEARLARLGVPAPAHVVAKEFKARWVSPAKFIESKCRLLALSGGLRHMPFRVPPPRRSQAFRRLETIRGTGYRT